MTDRIKAKTVWDQLYTLTNLIENLYANGSPDVEHEDMKDIYPEIFRLTTLSYNIYDSYNKGENK